MNRSSLLLFCFMVVIHFGYSAYLPLHPDEAYYWVWSQKLQLSYFDHPPMVAYLIKLATLLGSNELSIRIVSVFCTSASAWLIFRLAKAMFSEKVAALSLVLFMFLPITQVGFHIVTPDAPLVLFWTSTVYLAYRAFFHHQTGYLYLAGLTGGLMLMSKYTGVLLFPALAIFLVYKKYRRLFCSVHLYGAIALSLIVFTPILLWNWQHDWISFKFQYGHGIAQTKVFNPAALGQFLIGQAGIANPLFFLAMLYYSVSKIKSNLQNDRLAFLFWPFFIVLAFFGYAAMFKKAELNWPVPAYITGTILLAYWLDRYKQRWVTAAGVVVTTILVALAMFPEAFPFLPTKAVIKSQYYGYREMFTAANKHVMSDRPVILSDSYQNASMAWYYLEGRPQVHILTSSRFSNYDYWRSELAGQPIDTAIYIGNPNKLPELQQLFAKVEQIDVLEFKNPYVERSFSVYRCTGFKGLLQTPFLNYDGD